MYTGLCVCSCVDLSVRVHFLHSGKVTLMWAGVLSGMSPSYGTKGDTVSENSSTAELRKHELPLPHTHFPLDDSVTSLEPGVKETRCVPTPTPVCIDGPEGPWVEHHNPSCQCMTTSCRHSTTGHSGVTFTKHKGFVLLEKKSILAFFFS